MSPEMQKAVDALDSAVLAVARFTMEHQDEIGESLRTHPDRDVRLSALEMEELLDAWKVASAGFASVVLAESSVK